MLYTFLVSERVWDTD